MTVSAKLLVSVSLFFALIWWWVGAMLFLAGALMYATAALLGVPELRMPADVFISE